jgi:phosphoribosylformylglycinamidine cyclo-ligase
VLPAGTCARLERARWKRPTIFDWLQREGNVSDAEMARTFNCGIGMTIVLPRGEADAAVAHFARAGVEATAIGEIVAREAGGPQTVVV